MNLFRKLNEYRPSSISKKIRSGVMTTLFSKNSVRDDDPLGAALSAESYTCGKSGSMNDDCINDVNQKLSATGYSLVPELSDTHISTYKNDKGEFGIAHRGTCPSCKDVGTDLLADGGLAIGFNTSMPNNRLKRTEDIVKKIKESDSDANIKLTGHSLGGHTSAYAMGNSKYLQDNVDNLSTYNLGANPLFSALTPAAGVDAETKKVLDQKTTHYRRRGYWVSAGIAANPVFGEVKRSPTSYIYNTIKEHDIHNFFNDADLNKIGNT